MKRFSFPHGNTLGNNDNNNDNIVNLYTSIIVGFINFIVDTDPSMLNCHSFQFCFLTFH